MLIMGFLISYIVPREGIMLIVGFLMTTLYQEKALC